jgi:ribosome recycling factor
MNAYGNGHLNSGVSSPDIRAMLAASFADEQEPLTAMVARAMIYAQDADRKLDQAKNVRAEAQRFRAEMQKTTMEQTEELCREMREEAEQDKTAAREVREEAESVWEAARAEFERGTILRQDAELILTAARAEAEEHRRTVNADAELDAISIRDSARTAINAELAERKTSVDEEIRKALAGIEKMQGAIQAELEAQELYTEALRFRAAAPKRDEPEERAPVAARRRTTARRPRAK